MPPKNHSKLYQSIFKIYIFRWQKLYLKLNCTYLHRRQKKGNFSFNFFLHKFLYKKNFFHSHNIRFLIYWFESYIEDRINKSLNWAIEKSNNYNNPHKSTSIATSKMKYKHFVAAFILVYGNIFSDKSQYMYKANYSNIKKYTFPLTTAWNLIHFIDCN